MYEQKRPDVAVFIDFENVYVSVRDKLNANPNFEAIMDRCSDLGRVVVSRAYADWYRYPRVTSALYANAIEPIYVATYYYDKDAGRTGRAIKNSVDMNLAIDAMKTLYTNTNIARFVLVTGDRDFIPLVNSIRQQGKEVYVIGIGGAASTHLAQSADEFVFYEQLVGKQVVASATATALSQRPGELTRVAEIFDPLPPLPTASAAPAAPAAAAAPAAPAAPAVAAAAAAAAAAESDVYAVLIEAVHLVRKRGYVSTLGSLKLVMKELMGGDFKESRCRDMNGRAFVKFKDFVVDAEKRGKVQVFTNGTVNEVFLPGEDPYKLSQFAQLLGEESGAAAGDEPAVLEAPAVEAVTVPATPAAVETVESAAARRRRRRPRRGASTRDQAGHEVAEDELAQPAVESDMEYVAPLEGAAAVVEVPVVEAVAPAEVSAVSAVPLEATPAAAAEPVVEEPVETKEPSRRRRRSRRTAEPTASGEESSLAEAVVEPATAVVEPAAAVVEPAAAVVEPATAVVEPAAAVVEPATAVVEPAAAVVEPTAADEAFDEPAEEPIEFSAEEWVLFEQTARSLGKPATFQQVADALRAALKAAGISRTNEQNRTMVKQALRREMFVRTVRGKRVYYTIAD